MNKTNRLVKHYEKLNKKERSLLMINANIKGDKPEYKRLLSSASVSTFQIRGDYETEAVKGWYSIHKDFIICKDSINKRLLVSEIFDDSSMSEDTLPNIASLEVAFTQVLKKYDLPVHHEMIDAFGCELVMKDMTEDIINIIKQRKLYQDFEETFDSYMVVQY